MNFSLIRRSFAARFGGPLDAQHATPRRRVFRLGVQALEERRLLAIDSGAAPAADYSPLDVDQDGQVTGLDALLVINEINRQQQALAGPVAASLPDAAQAAASNAALLDIDGDGSIQANDAQLVLDALDEEVGEKVLRIRLEITDLAGNPITQIAQGSEFLVKAYALDLRAAPDNTGVFAAFADVTWESALASFVSGSIDHGTTYVTGPSGTATPGMIDEFGGISGQISPPLGSAEKLLGSMKFQATAAGTIHFAADPAETIPQHNSLLYGGSGAVPTEQIEYGAANLLVLSTETVTVSIAPPSAAAVEGNAATTPLTFTVSLSAASAQSITVNYAAAAGTAAANDFQAAAGTLTFAPGETTKTITVNVVGDTRDEADTESFNVTLTNPSAGAQLGTASATGEITDDDDAPTLSISDPADVTEGTGSNVGVNFTVTLSAASDKTVTVNYATLAGTATANDDFVPTSGTLTFAPGETSKTITVNVVGDAIDEVTEVFGVQLSGATNATIVKATGSVDILDNDAAPTLLFDNPVKLEPDSGTSDMVFTISLQQASGQTVTVNYETIPGTATSPADFTAVTGSVTFAPGETTKTIIVPINSDDQVEGVETFKLRMTGTNISQTGPVEATGTIADSDVPEITISPATVIEGTGGAKTLVFTVALSQAGTLPATVAFATSNGTATAGSDYTATSGTLTFAANETSKTISVTINTDALDEDNEDFTLTLSNPVNVKFAGGASSVSAVGTIEDDDNPPMVSIAPASTAEGNSGTKQLAFTVTLSVASGKTVTVQYATSPGTAEAGSDYTTTTGTLTFAPGETSKTINVPILGDNTIEPNENFTLAISSPTNATLGTATATGTINDDDDLPKISIDSPAAVDEGTGTTVTFTVTLSRPGSEAITVDYATSPGTATEGADYTAQSGTLTFAAGETTKTIVVSVTSDTRDETNETFFVALSNPSSNAALPPAQATGTATINDDDAAPTVSIGTPAAILEGNTGTKQLQFTVTLSAASGQTVTVQYATAPGTATAGSDYTTTTGTLTFAPGETSKTFSVPILSDETIEPNETFTATISSPTNATLGTATATGTITDDDDFPTISISNPPAAVTEGTGTNSTLNFTVSLSKQSTETITVTYTTSNGTANSGSDYTHTTGILTFAPGETSKTISVNVLGDVVDEDSETFSVTLSNPSANATLTTGQTVATGTINDDDDPPKISIADPVAIAEGNGTKTLNFVVTLSAASSRTITVKYSTADGTAIAGQDYTAVSGGTVTFAPGETSKNIAITILGDITAEATENFTVTLSDPTQATLDTKSTATGTIGDDDAQVTISDASVVEGQSGLSQMKFTVSLSNPQAVDVTVRVTTHNGTALAGTDYRQTTDRVVTIPAGQTSVEVAIDVGGELLPEADETFTLELSNPTNATLGGKTIGTGTIINDDQVVSISGFTYMDLNDNGVKDPGERPLPGVKVRLVGTDVEGTAVEITKLTNNDGSYNFQNLNPGTYRVVQSQPAGLLDGKDTLFNGNQGSVNDQLSIALGAESRANNNFGERGTPPRTISKRNFFASNQTTYPTTPPALAATGSPAAVNIANANNTTVSGTGTPGAFIALVANDGSKSSAGYTTQVAANGAWSISGIDVSMLKDGTITYQIAASDSFGNSILTTRTATKTTVAITTATNSVNNADPIASISGTGQNGATVKVVVSDSAATPHTVEGTATIANGVWTVSGLNLSTLVNGVITYTVTATDADNNSVTTTRKAIRGQ